MPPNTPPPSPGISGSSINAPDDELDENDVVEVIDLDELDNNEEPDEEDLDENEMNIDDNGDMSYSEESGSNYVSKMVEVNSVAVFSMHQKSVFTCDINPNENVFLAVSGGEDDKAFIWNWKTGNLVTELGASQPESPTYKDSVVFTKFNKDGSLVAAADMSGMLKVWRIPKSLMENASDSQCSSEIKKEPLWSFETSDISWLRWHNAAQNVLFAGTEESELWMWKIPSGDSKIYMGNGEKVETAIILPDGKRIAVAYGDGSIKLFDLKTGEVLNNFAHYDKSNSSDDSETSIGMPIASLNVRSDGGGQILASGGVNGVTKIFNTSTGKTIGNLLCGGSNTQDSDSDTPSTTTVEDILFSSCDHNVLITGTLNGKVTIWDVSTHVSKHSINIGEGVVKMLWRNVPNATAVNNVNSLNRKNSSQIFVATLEGVVKILDIREGKVLADCSGHTASILDICQSVDGSTLISCSDDGDCRVFDVDKVLSGVQNSEMESS